jgi:hypothetical protein
MEKLTKHQLTALRDTIDSLDGWDSDDITDLDVQLDTLASALSQLQPKRRTGKRQQEDPTLSGELAALVEDDALDELSVSIADEIAELIRTKDYVGYSEGYVEKRLAELVGDLCSELGELVESLADATGK